MRRAREGYGCGSPADQPRRDLRTLADEIDRLLLAAVPEPTPEQAAEWREQVIQDATDEAAGVVPLGAGPWKVADGAGGSLPLTRDQVLEVLDALPASATGADGVFVPARRAHRSRLVWRALDLLKSANLAHYDKSARLWVRTETPCPPF